jgi:hypothetical protein
MYCGNLVILLTTFLFNGEPRVCAKNRVGLRQRLAAATLLRMSTRQGGLRVVQGTSVRRRVC